MCAVLKNILPDDAFTLPQSFLLTFSPVKSRFPFSLVLFFEVALCWAGSTEPLVYTKEKKRFSQGFFRVPQPLLLHNGTYATPRRTIIVYSKKKIKRSIQRMEKLFSQRKIPLIPTERLFNDGGSGEKKISGNHSVIHIVAHQ